MYLLNDFANQTQIQRFSLLSDEVYNFANKKLIPIIVTDLMEKWPAKMKWTLQFFKEKFGHLGIAADKLVDGQRKYIYQNISDYIDFAKKSEEMNPYYAKSTIHLSSELKKDYTVPSHFRCWYNTNKNKAIELSCLYIGPKHSKCELHIDIWGSSFWNALFQGRKLWVFYKKNPERIIKTGIDPFTTDKVLHNEKAIVAIQEPGEVVFCPGNVWHAVYNLEPSLVLSENFVNGSNYNNVLDHFKNMGQKNALFKMRNLVAENLPNFVYR